MKTYFDRLHKRDDETNEEKKRRYILYIIIIIIIILLLITSCSCTSNLIGKIGDFLNGGSYNITDDNKDKEKIRNQELQFDNQDVEMSLSDSRMKLSFSYKNINPSSFSCSTSNADVATCYVSNNYVVIIPKTVGNIVVTLQTTTNGKVYEATANVTITDATRSINLSSTSGILNLAESKYKNIPYTLVGLTGDIKITSSDEGIATAVASDGMLQITAYKTGQVTITLSLTYNDVTYIEKYTLNVIKKSSSSTKPGDNTKPNEGGNTNPDNPDKPDQKDPVYEVNIFKLYDDNSPYYLEDYTSSNPYYIKYEVLKDGVLADENTLKNVKIETSNNIQTEVVKINGEYFIKVTPTNDIKSGDKATIKVSSNGKTEETTIDFKIHDYNLEINPTTYNLNYKDGNSFDEFIINTDKLFKGNVDIINSSDKLISICSKDKKTCVKVEVLDEYKDYISIKYDADSNQSTSSFPISVSVTDKVLNGDIGDSIEKYIRVSAISYGETLKVNGNDYQDVQINLVENYVLTIYPNNKEHDGYFKGTSIDTGKNQKQEIPMEYDYQVILSDYIAYGIHETNNCLYYPIKEYVDDAGNIYSLDTVITNLTSNLTLYPVFESTPQSVTPDQETNKIYLTDVDIFRYFRDKKGNKYEGYYVDESGTPHEGQSIFPGANGSYVITLNNKTSTDITIKGVTLTEDTICIKNSGCLNIGYKLRLTVPGSTDRYLYGTSERYAILNQDSWKKTSNSNPNRSVNYNEIGFSPMINVPINSSIEMVLFWKWVEGEDISNDKNIIREYDAIDTAIGTYVADKVNEKYTLTLSIDFAHNICEMPTDIKD